MKIFTTKNFFIPFFYFCIVSCSKEEIQFYSSKETKIIETDGVLKKLGISKYSETTLDNIREFSLENSSIKKVSYNEYNRLDLLLNKIVLVKRLVYKDEVDEFSIEMTEKSFSYQDNKNGKYNFVLIDGLLYDNDRKQKFNQKWYEGLKIDPNKLYIPGAILEDARKRNLISTPSHSVSQKNKMFGLNTIAYSNFEYGGKVVDCTRKCSGNTVWDWSETWACEAAKLSKVLTACCSTPRTIGCCEILGCDCYSIFGSYYAFCTAKAWAPKF